MPIETGAIGAQQFVGAYRHEDAVYWRQGAVLLQQREETLPALSVGRGVGILGRVASGRIDKRRLVGEPEIEIAGSADALDRLVGKRKTQARIEQRRRLAGAGRADDHVPRAAVKIVAAALAVGFERGQSLRHAS